jgi:glycosyltransferase involved in cell wall biosynthesis
MAHGQDVRNVGAIPGVRAATAAVVRRAHTVIFNSAYLRDQLPLKVRSSEVIDCGVDLDSFRHRDQAQARAQLNLPPDLEPPVILFAGALIERKNVLRLREAMTEGTLLVAGDGPLRSRLEGDERVHLAGRQPYAKMPLWMAAADVVALPSLEEPFGQALLEAMASERSVVATRQGGPPEFVTPEAGALVDPLDTSSIREGLHHAAALGSPNPAARAAAAPHALDAQAERMEAVLARAARPRP